MLNTEDILCKMLFAQLQSIGFFTERKSQPVLENFYGRWFEESQSILERHQFLKRTENGHIPTRSIGTIGELWKEWNEQKSDLLQDNNMKAMVTLVETALKALPDILTGKASATDILFPDSSMDLVEGVYKNNQVADYFNDVLADTLIAYLQERLKQEPEAKIRILEIGAGTGGTSAAVFQKLKAWQTHIKEYCYTDLSKAFLMHAENKYGPDNPYLTYKRFNVEKPASEQHIDAGSYDVVIAANVLHATKNIRQTLRNAKAVLKKNGLLLLNEISDHNIYSHLTFGLLEGWWLYEDPDLRIPGCPGLYPDTWKMALESEGYRYVSFIAEQSHQLGQQIIVAESDGVVRQKKRTETEEDADSIQMNAVKAHSQESESLIEQTTQFVKHTLAKSIKLSPERIHEDTTFEKYGIDSILQVNFIRELEKVTGDLPKTILFEHNNTKELVDYLVKEHESKLRTVLLKDTPQLIKNEAPVQTKRAAASKPFSYTTRRFAVEQQVRETQQALNDELKKETTSNFQDAQTKGSGTEDIAIIGVSGRYPMSDSLEEVWAHL
ncbi:methyltransferase, partial [Bacillus spizizenii]|nr:methyltransferase [Bacillus spizizenii]